MKYNNAENIDEFINLIHRYETITLKEILEKKKKYFVFSLLKTRLTGYGHVKKCTLCLKVDTVCFKCVYEKEGGCVDYNKKISKSYLKIGSASTPEELLSAYRYRAKVLRKLAEKKNIKID
jgi:hypothetical protein